MYFPYLRGRQYELLAIGELLEKAYKNFFRNTSSGFPKYKKKKSRQEGLIKEVRACSL
jgi:transposase